MILKVINTFRGKMSGIHDPFLWAECGHKLIIVGNDHHATFELGNSSCMIDS